MTPQTAVSPGAGRTENLALIFQEVLTAIVRLRSGRQESPDAETFRYHIREAVLSAARDAVKRASYDEQDVKIATLAVVGFLDESILNSANPMFADWQRKPLQQELFQVHRAGEVFFDNLDRLVARNDSADLADLLEIYYLCLLLGYKGRYTATQSGELQAKQQIAAEKIRRIRGAPGELSPTWALPNEVVRSTNKSKIRPLVIAAIVCLAVTIVLFAIFKLSLVSGVSDLRALAPTKT